MLDGLDAEGWRNRWREADLERLRLRDAVRRMGLDPESMIEREAALPTQHDPVCPMCDDD